MIVRAVPKLVEILLGACEAHHLAIETDRTDLQLL
jgi:hypothetical protein